jgi:ADP-ribose pyrophosphatase
VHHPGGAAAVAIDAQERVCLLRQYRHAADGWLWELPAGKLEPDEPPLSTAQRELIEEAGVKGRDWESLGSIFSSPGVFGEVLHLYLATGLEAAVAAPEASEVFEVHWKPFQEACAWALDGTIRDGKTALGLLRARHRLAAAASPARAPDP